MVLVTVAGGFPACDCSRHMGCSSPCLFARIRSTSSTPTAIDGVMLRHCILDGGESTVPRASPLGAIGARTAVIERRHMILVEDQDCHCGEKCHDLPNHDAGCNNVDGTKRMLQVDTRRVKSRTPATRKDTTRGTDEVDEQEG